MAGMEPYYPPRPPGVPHDLTAPTARYRFQVLVVLASLMAFFVLYLGLVVTAGWLCYWSMTYPVGQVNRGTVFVKVFLIGSSALGFLFLLKNFFKRHKTDKALQIEITEHEQPVLFAFIHRLCEETRAPFPRRVYLSPDVNAAVFYNTSILSLFLPTPKNLLIGLGLVNSLTLSEFKAVLAHEFGHFSQSSMKVGSYVYLANRIIGDVVYGRDWFDDLLAKLRSIDVRITVFVMIFYGMQWVLRKILEGFFRAINFLNMALSRQMEFNADLVAVSVTGSDALVHGLARLDFATEALNISFRDVSAAADHKLYSRDLFFHQSHAFRFLRRVRKDAKLGEPPPLSVDPEVKTQVFEPGDVGIPPMWASHPSNYDRERNAKRVYIRGIEDQRSPWILFRNAADTRRKLTRRFYRMALKVKKDVELSDPEIVQEFIDTEHAETTYDERYHGIYDGRFLEPGGVPDLLQTVHCDPWPEELLVRVHAQLYSPEVAERSKRHQRRLEEYEKLEGLTQGELKVQGKAFEFRGARHPAGDASKLMKKVERELDKDRKWLASIDRKVFLTYFQMAQKLDGRLAADLEERYRFHLGTQDILRELSKQQGRVGAALAFLTSKRNLSAEEFGDAMTIFRQAHGALSRSLSEARQLLLPELKNMTAGQPLNAFLLEKRLVYELLPEDDSITGEWINKFWEQLGNVQDKARRIHFKSLGGILALQENIGRLWSEKPMGEAQSEIAEAIPVVIPEVVLEALRVEVEPTKPTKE
jgi:Zn-dependent protease with chaperone function